MPAFQECVLIVRITRVMWCISRAAVCLSAKVMSHSLSDKRVSPFTLLFFCSKSIRTSWHLVQTINLILGVHCLLGWDKSRATSIIWRLWHLKFKFIIKDFISRRSQSTFLGLISLSVHFIKGHCCVLTGVPSFLMQVLNHQSAFFSPTCLTLSLLNKNTGWKKAELTQVCGSN